jgi:hypothetical protein
VTVMPWPGAASVLPLAGVIDTCRPEGVLAPDLPPEDVLPPPEQAAATRASAVQIAAMTSQRYLRAAEDGLVAPTTGPPIADR